jgi:hypothetical protein
VGKGWRRLFGKSSTEEIEKRFPLCGDDDEEEEDLGWVQEGSVMHSQPE